VIVGALESPNPVLGSVALRGTRFIEDIKARPDVLTIMVTPGNREDLFGELVTALDELGL
jgi:nucleoside-triphosphatase THEP1